MKNTYDVLPNYSLKNESKGSCISEAVVFVVDSYRNIRTQLLFTKSQRKSVHDLVFDAWIFTKNKLLMLLFRLELPI